jgi:hypothetical protein
MAVSRPESSSLDNPQFSSLASRGPAPVKLPAPRPVTFRLKDADRTVKSISPFYIQTALDSIAGETTSASRLKSGTLLVEARNETQAEVFLKATVLGSHPVHL